MNSGFVYIVGAGVGGVGNLTVRAKELLGEAEVVLADDLVDESVKSLVPPTCTWQTVGKRGGKPSATQDEINQLLVELAQNGKTVVRLKNGDPWVFGRASQEIRALQAAGIGWTVIPGVSSALVSPLLAGIPLTETDRSPCFVVATGHDPDRLPWQALAEIPTLVILMGTRFLDVMRARLQAYRPAETPIAVIHRAGSWQQQVWTGTLRDLTLPADVDLSPAVIVIGELVTDRSFFTPSLPLAHKKILVTRAAGQSSEFVQGLEKLGAYVLEMPTLEITPPSSWEALDRAIGEIERYHWLILTSANGIESFFSRLFLQNKDVRALHHLKIAVVGKKTKEMLQTYGVVADLVPPNFVADSLVAVFPDVRGQNILFPRVESGGRDVLITQLTAKGATVDSVPAYESICPQTIPTAVVQAIASRTIDVITFASSKTVLHFAQLLDGVTDRATWQSWLENAKIASIGSQTSRTCQDIFQRVDIEAQEFTLAGLQAAIVEYFRY
ncbi:MAG: uroporphyrinogen-III C-methyltransferase [Pseudanabaenaceae cyanobacterium SKYGB_i_bin29]|nr:uroporphyrinogen-III C-methyltransferase [Pseudanabaenaceae cyanobacterium SKYG29]MDW8420603.1 uroporphyrinogen-III C-methyltransferase [Pseudanabaenaceae cyanobacterium SKYGB_i_bin29]